jgi:crotonobetainyl-CoA:carnitine CoA-transferase CaiB-like acyl-CoA transferase
VATPADPVPLPLAGRRVLELAEGTPAAFCGRVLSDLGADVVMVEPPGGPPLRWAEPCREDGVSGRYLYLASGKHRVTAKPGVGIGKLCEEADVIVTDLDPSRLEAVTDGASRAKPTAVVSPFGLSGPYSGRRADHLTIFHGAGESSTLPSGMGFEMFPERAPIQLGSDIAFFDAGWNAALVALSLMYPAGSAADPLVADLSVQEAEITLSRTRLNRWLNEGVRVERQGPRYGIAGMLRCQDGWIQLVGIRDEHWDRLVQSDQGTIFLEAGLHTVESRAARNADLGRVLAEWCLQLPKVRAAAVLSGLGAPVGIYADAADCMTSDQLAHRGFFRDVDDGAGGSLTVPGPPYRISYPGTGPGSPTLRRRAPTDGRPLEGVRVLDFTWAAAGPYATLLLIFLGAEVVKVESLRRPDPARGGFLGQRYDGLDRSPIFNELNLGKRSLQIDLTQPESLNVIREIVGTFDVVVDNFRPGVMERLGLGAAALLADHPHLIVASSSANGSTGPDAMGAGLASIFAASGGLSVQTGYADGPPTEVSDTMDYRSGTALAVAIVAALVGRDRTGWGCCIDLSSREVVIASSPDAVLAASLGVDWQLRVGNGHRTMAPHGVYPTGGGSWLALAIGTDEEWAALCGVLGRPQWVGRLATADDRRRAEDEVTRVICDWTSGRTATVATDILADLGIAAMPVMTFESLANDGHLAERGVLTEVEHPEIGVQRVMRAPWSFRGLTPTVPASAPLLGADNEMILAGSDLAAGVAADRRGTVFR